MMRTKSESEDPKKAWYLKRTTDSLTKYKMDFKIVDAVDGKKEGAKRIAELINTTFSPKLSLSRQGLFASHVLAWLESEKLGRPVVSLESDTEAIREFDVDPKVYEDYDVVYIHDHPRLPSKCQKTNSTSYYVREGLKTWFATGAMLFTGRRHQKLKDALQTQVKVPIDHWLNAMWGSKQLKVGALCPAVFKQNTDHESSIENNGFMQ
jgi:GR25 family glycosyltransferase involved in LPS biosynthesis